ncbi:hybrid sensor histidine kinase/response regulator [Pseudoalteromonas sp. MSK9-3]|uniref:hybrid sensor histidine kinase/response regulator n=1 Tax=Pseudoalteromonas sp. MSK9-3 TaxID=1897633 RepID=UPI000E6C6DB3|nr:ATP-binding protein [Pseudoalteromonas sp. MSK9-3]RJE76234.1 hybrid sensor histidine kinase/response regulator [Pseudoalteromonas sp. MSK9-3]
MSNKVLIIDSNSVLAMRLKVLFELLGGQVEHIHYNMLDEGITFTHYDVIAIAHGIPSHYLTVLSSLKEHCKLILLAPKPDNTEHLEVFSQFNKALPNGIVVYPFFANKEITHLLERVLEVGANQRLVLPTVLLVDHDATRLEQLAMSLRGAQLTVFTALTIGSALEVASKEHIDLLISDFNFADGTGVEMFVQLKGLSPNCRCLLFTSRASQVDMMEAIRQGVEDVLLKPFDESELLQSLHKLWQTELLRRQNQELVERLQDTVDALIERDSLLRVIYKHTPDPIVLFKRSGAIIEANDASMRLLKLSQSEIQARSLYDLFATDCTDSLKVAIKEVGIKRHFNCELVLPQASGDIPLMGTFNEIDHHGEVAFAVIFKNVAHLKKKQQVLEEAKEVLEAEVQARTAQLQSAKDAAEAANLSKSEFLANMSHELRTPMHSILSFARFGLDKLSCGEAPLDKLQKYLSRIETSGERLLLLLNNLLDLSRLDAGRFPFNPSNYDFTSIIKTGIDDVAGSALAKKIQFELCVPSTPILLYCDQEQMNQVVRNLLGNALKFSPENSQIKVAVDLIGNKVAVAISDQGVGIPDDELEQVFSKFVQSSKTNNGAGGTGLGLAICKEFILLHKGCIYASNNEFGGATVHIELPLSQH